MKVIFTFLFVCFYVFSNAQTTFKTKLNVGRNSDLYQAIPDIDGSIVAVGFTYSQVTETQDILITRFSKEGLLLSSKTINSISEGENGYDRAFSIIKTSDGGFAISATLDEQFSILKLDKSLNVTWRKQYTKMSGESDAYKILQTSDGGFVAVGKISVTDNNTVGYFLRTDKFGNVLASKKYFDQFRLGINNIENYVTSISATKDGNYVMIGSKLDDTTPNDNYKHYLIKITPDGNILWVKNFHDSNNTVYLESIIQTSDNNLVVAGSLVNEFINGNEYSRFEQTVIAKFDTNGNNIWSKYLTVPSINENYIYSVYEDKSSNLIIGGRFTYVDKTLEGSDTSYTFIGKINKNGDLLLCKLMDSSITTGQEFESFAQTDDGYIASGTYYNDYEDYEDSYGMLYKFDSNLEICGQSKNTGYLVSFGTAVATTEKVDSAIAIVSVPEIDSLLMIETSSYLCNNTLPLQLLSFNATLQNKTVNIEWETANEVNTDYFMVERGTNSTSFTMLQKIAAKSNSTKVQTYTTNDLQPLSGTSYYRLKEVDKDGSVTYSSIVPVTVTANGTIIISPNPVHNTVRVLLQSKTASQLTFLITDITGKVLITQTAKVNEGINTINLPAASLAKGIYILKVIENNNVQSMKFVKE